MNGDISYNGTDLQTYNHTTRVGIITNAIEHTDAPEKLASLYPLADANGSSIPAVNFPSRRVRIAGAIQGSTQADLDSRIDAFKGLFTGKDKNLDIEYAGSTRRYIATANTVSVTRQQHSPYANFAVEFVCTNPFGIDVSATVISNRPGHTTPTFTETPTIQGSAPYQLPVYTITINALTGAGDYIQVSNDNNGQEILVYGVGFAVDDVLVIDCAERTVTLNDTEVDYYGSFLELEPGANSITYTDGFTTRNADVVATYVKRWM